MMADFRLEAACPQKPLHASLFHEWVFPDGTPWMEFYRSEENYLLRFPELADFQLTQDGRRVQGWPAPGVSDATIRHLYLNQVLPLAFSKQGKLVFHAGAVEIGGVGIAFIGESVTGKSTLAASFATNGFRFLTDDGLVLEPCDGEYRIMPSHPSIRLWQDSEAALVGEDAQKAPPVQFTSKARLLAGESIAFCRQSQNLRRLYFLGEGKAREPVFKPMNPGETVIELVKHSFLLDIEAREALAAHFDELARLASRPLFFRLDYPRRFEVLPQVRQAIVEHVNEVD